MNLSPSWSDPLDPAERITATPAEARARGMFLTQVVERVDSVRGVKIGQDRYLPFMWYPLQEYMELLVEGATLLHPDVSLREGLRRLGHDVYPHFVSTMVGSAIFAFAGRSFTRVVSLAGRGYAVTVEPGTVTFEEVGRGVIRVHLRDLWTFPDAFHVGVWEGAMRALDVNGSIDVEVHSPCDVDFILRWR